LLDQPVEPEQFQQVADGGGVGPDIARKLLVVPRPRRGPADGGEDRLQRMFVAFAHPGIMASGGGPTILPSVGPRVAPENPMLPLVTLSLVCCMDTPKDPYQWLEDVTGEKALAWVKARNAVSTAELAKSAEFAALEKRLLTILDSKERIPYISKRGAMYYNFWRDDKN